MMTAQRRYATLDGLRVPYTFKRSSRARYVRIEVGSESGLTVVAPARRSLERVHQFIQQKQRWILEKLKKYGHVRSEKSPSQLKTGDTIPYLGRNMRIETRECSGRPEGVRLNRQGLVVSTAPGPNRVDLALEKWYRSEARKKISGMADEQCRVMGVTHNRITLKGHKSIWGSCSRKKNLNFNWRLMMAPEPVIRYVVIHEVAHLVEMNHSKRFWQIVERYCPDWHEHREWLRTHAAEINGTLRR